MTQSDRLNTAVAALGEQIASEIADLAAAIAKLGVSDPAIDASIDKLNELTAQLQADNPAP